MMISLSGACNGSVKHHASSHNHSVTAEALAEELEVSKRTIYRDIQALQAMRTPIDGEAGVGYMMRNGYDLPAINFADRIVQSELLEQHFKSESLDLLSSGTHYARLSLELSRQLFE